MADLIDRQAAIDAICNTGCYDFGYSCDLCVSKAALENVPGYAKPFDTAISWREAMNAVKSLPCVTDEQGNVWILRADVEAKLTVMPDARKTGKWLRPVPNRPKTYERYCSVCHEKAWYCGTGDYKFCPNCGAQMKVQ